MASSTHEKAVKMIQKGLDLLNSIGEQAGAGYYSGTEFKAIGHPSFRSVLIAEREKIENHPDFNTTAISEMKLPPIPELGHSFTFKIARAFLLNDIVPIVFKDYKKGFYRDIHLKPSWWHLRWESLGKAGHFRDDFLQLIINLYTHHGYDIDMSTVIWTNPKRIIKKKPNDDLNAECASCVVKVSKNSNILYLVDYIIDNSKLQVYYLFI